MTSPVSFELQAAILRRGKLLDHCSSVLTVIALLAGLSPLLGIDMPPGMTVAWITISVMGLAEKYWAMRVMVDAELFSWLGRHADHVNQHTHELDEALAALGLKSRTARSRDWTDRGKGAMSLLYRQLSCLLVQSLLILILTLCLSW